MAKGASKRGRSMAPVSQQLEEFWPINFDVIGQREWIDGCFVPGAILDSQKVYVSSPADLAESKEWLDKEPQHIVDTETAGPGKYGGLDPLNPQSRITMLQMGTDKRVLVIDPALIPEYKGHLESEDHLHVLQHALFDFKFLWAKYNIHMKRMFCTMLSEQLLTSGLSGVGVGMPDIVRKYHPHRLITKEVRKHFMDFQETGQFTEVMVWYAIRDIAALAPVVVEQCKMFERWKMEKVAQDEFDVIPCTAMMELGGVPIDVSILRLAIGWWQKRELELMEQISLMFDQRVSEQGDKNLFLLPEMREVFDINSASQKLEALRRIGVDVDDTKRDTLEAVGDPLTKLLVEYSEVAKVVSTYGEGLIAKVDPATGCLYPEFNQLGSGDIESRAGKVKKSTIATGRYSSDFQQLPRPEARFERVLDPAEIKNIRATFREELVEVLQETPI